MKCLRTLILAATLAAPACYQDDPLDGGRQNRTRVFLTDAPFPFDSVGSVNIYIVRIEATTSLDTSAGAGTEPWQTIAEPHRAFDLLALQQGLTAAIGEGLLSAGTYRAVRLTINVDSSSIKWLNGTDAPVDWQNGSGPELRLYALVESPVDVPQEGVDLVIDFDLGRSFLYNLYGTHEFTLQHWLRAVNAAATGAIAGTVTSAYTGATLPIRNANVAVYDVHFFSPYLVATGHTDAQGYFKIAFLPPGASYQLEIQQPNYPFLVRFHAWGSWTYVAVRGFQGGMLFTKRRKIEPENWKRYLESNRQWRPGYPVPHPFRRRQGNVDRLSV